MGSSTVQGREEGLWEQAPAALLPPLPLGLGFLCYDLGLWRAQYVLEASVQMQIYMLPPTAFSKNYCKIKCYLISID